MPSAPILGEYDKVDGPVEFEYGKWSSRWEVSELRYEPPYRPSVRLCRKKQDISIRQHLYQNQQIAKDVTSDPNSIYRLPGFNHHIPKEEKAKTLNSSTRFQTPQEGNSYKSTQKLNSHSKPMKKLVPAAKSETKVFGDRSSKEAIELHRMLTNTNSSTSAGSSMAVELYVSDLLKRADLTLSPTPNIQNEVVEPTNHPNQKLANAEGLFHLEADGTNEVWIPSGRMPSKREQFATYPAVSLRREGLQLLQNGWAVRQQQSWPLELEDRSRMENIAVRKMQRAVRNVKTSREEVKHERSSHPKPASRVATRERVYPNLVEGDSIGQQEQSPATRPRLEIPNLLEGSKVVSPPSLVSLTNSHYSQASISPRSSKVIDLA